MDNNYKSINQFVRAYYEKNPDGHYFDRDTLKFFGESISTMRVLKGLSIIKDYMGNERKAICISKLSRKYPGGACRTYGYFDPDSLEDVTAF